MNTTTRKHPRSLNEAFPTGTEYANAIEHHRRDISGRIIVYAALAVGAFCSLLIFSGALLWAWTTFFN